MSNLSNNNHIKRHKNFVRICGLILAAMIFLADPPVKAFPTCDSECRERDTIYWIPNKDCFTFQEPTCEFCVGATGRCENRDFFVGKCNDNGKMLWYRTDNCSPVCDPTTVGVVTVEGKLFKDAKKKLYGLESWKKCKVE